MYLTRINLDSTNRKTMAAYTQRNLFHGALEHAFTGERERTLWRLDRVAGKDYMLILSPSMPNTDGLVSQFGTGNPAESKDYGILLNRIQNGSMWGFRLVANPTRVVTNGETKKIVAHTSVQFQKEWLMRTAESYGFMLKPEWFGVNGSSWEKFTRENSTITFLSVTFEGTLKVTDADKLRKAIASGIGREKAYGMGMITLARMA